MGAQFAAEIEQSSHFVTDGKINRRLLEIATPIFTRAVVERPDLNFQIRLIDDPQVNAFSVPGGYIYLYRGLYDKIGADDDALASVIAHETAHVVLRHAVKQISDEQAKGALVDIVAILSKNNTVGEVGSAIADLDQLHFSREDEYQADRYGMRYAYEAGFDPSGMLRTFVILSKIDSAKDDNPPAYAQDHPITRNRALRALEQLRELRANHGKYITTDYNANGDREAAKANGLDYEALVLATAPPEALGLGPDHSVNRKTNSTERSGQNKQ